MQQIMIKKLDMPKQKKVPEDIRWVCDSFGFASGRDTALTSTKVLSGLLHRVSENLRVSSEMIAGDLDISPSTVNHHVRHLIDSGMVYRQKRMILLRGGSLKSAVEEMRKDANRLFDEIAAIAEEIDSSLGLENRG